MAKKFKNFMPKSAVQICIDLCESDLHGDWRTREKVRSELFAQLCRLAKRYHTRALWYGNDSVCQPDKFLFVKNGRQYLFHIDGIRYDGVNANCIDDRRYFGTDIFTTRNTLNECSKGMAFVSTGAKTCFVSGIGTCTDTNIIIPPVHNGEKVTGIGCYAFFDCTDLTSVTIPDSVTGIGDFAFSGCYGLKSVTIPDSVTEIGDFVFSACTGLQDITIGNGVTSIGWGTFSMCHSLVSITIPDSVTSIGDSAFDDCRSLVSITIPDSVASISDSAFRRCDSLKNITMGNGISLEF